MNPIKEAIVVEGRDDTAAINRAVCGHTIETHGFGIRKETWALLEKAYWDLGLIIFTDPDHSGEEIRKKLSDRFPLAKHAYLSRSEATKGTDIGIENAQPQAIQEALEKAHYSIKDDNNEFTLADMTIYGLSGTNAAAARRDKLGKVLGIGYGNSRTFLKKLNQFGIDRETFLRHIQEI